MRSLGFWRVLDRARALNLEAGGLPPAHHAAHGITRRRVLAAMAAGAAAATLPGCFRAGPQRIGIIGGGLAGLVALDRLRGQGVEAALYEARAAVGGRTRSVRGVFAPHYAFDEGGQLVNSDHKDLIGLVRALGLKLIDRQTGGEGQELQIGPRGLVAETALAQELRGIAARITADSDRLDKDYDSVAREIDVFSVRQYLDRHGLAQGNARDAIEAAIRTEYGAEPDDASALELIFNLPTVDGERVTRLSLSDERFLVDGGTGQIAQALADRHEAAIRLGKRLVGIDMRGPGARIAFADGEQVHFDRLILALPAPLLREIRIDGPLPEPWRNLIAEVRLGQCEKIIAGYDRTSWRSSIGAGGALWAAKDFSEAWDAASATTAGDAPGALTYFLAGDQVAATDAAGAADLAKRFSATARKALTDLPEPNGRVRRTRWCADPFSKGAYMNFRPGQLTRFGGLLTLEEEGTVRPSRAGPLLFAGEWLSDAWPGYMNGAVQTGRIAADAALAAEPVEAAAT